MNQKNIEYLNVKSNKTFMLLSFFGIMMVVDCHLNSNLGFFNSIFPYDSFFMPMFVFISGYFFNSSCIKNFKMFSSFIFKKIKTLILPFVYCVVSYLIIITLLNNTGFFNFYIPSNKQFLLNIFCLGTSCGFNDPTWFVMTLFYVCLVYISLKFLFKKIWNEIVSTLILIIIGCISIYLSKTSLNNYNWFTCIIRIGFFLQFYQIGFVFKHYLEKRIRTINGLFIASICVAVNLLLIGFYRNDINFASCAFMKGFRTNNLFLPLLSSLSGILFWYSVSKGLENILGNVKTINMISANTFLIMANHLTIKFLFNSLLFIGVQSGNSIFKDFDVDNFKTNPWYIFNNSYFKIVCFFFTCFVLIIMCYVYSNLKHRLKTYSNKKPYLDFCRK